MKKSFQLIIILTICNLQLFAVKNNCNSNPSAYLFVYFTGNDIKEEQIRFAVSTDGYNYKALNNNQPVIKSSEISITGGVRDPHILRSQDGKTFYMVVTDMVSVKGWSSNRGMVLLKPKGTVMVLKKLLPTNLQAIGH